MPLETEAYLYVGAAKIGAGNVRKRNVVTCSIDMSIRRCAD